MTRKHWVGLALLLFILFAAPAAYFVLVIGPRL
jgi:hypothetical protein